MRDYYVEPIFSTPLYSSRIDTKDELEVLERLVYTAPDDHGLMITENFNVLNMPEMIALKRQIDGEVERFVRDYLRIDNSTKFNMIRSWGVAIPPNKDTKSHHHGNSVISGVVYLDALQNSGDIRFEHLDKLFTRMFQFSYGERNQCTADFWQKTPQIGSIFLFPSNIKHKVMPNMTKTVRHSIAFDYWPSGEIGACNQRSSLKIRP